MGSSYYMIARPPDTDHGHPFLVYDCQKQLHFPLTRFSKLALKSCIFDTVRGYLYALLPYFTWLDTDFHQLRSQRHWRQPPDQVRYAVDDYLTQHLYCQIQEHTLGFQLVRRTAKTPSQIRTFLIALKCFYKLMKRNRYYPFENPLTQSISDVSLLSEVGQDEFSNPPRMPQISGVEKPDTRARLTDSYFKLEGDEWVPQIIDTPDLPAQIMAAGLQLNWQLREQCVTRILFESGGRISEVVGSTLDDWMKYGLQRKIAAFSKRSNGRRVKALQFSPETCTLLWRYFNTERVKYDPNGYTLYEYQEQARLQQVDLTQIPLFLSQQRTPLSPDNFRDNYWKPACIVAEIEANLHQARHWYVTQIMRQIHALASDEAEIEHMKRMLQDYMAWRSDDTIKAYDHFFDRLAYDRIQDSLHTKMNLYLQEHLESPDRAVSTPLSTSSIPAKSTSPTPEDEDFNYLRQIGGGHCD